MGKKVGLNVIYNLGIFFCLYIIYWGFQNHQYAYVAAGLFIAVVIIMLKIRLIKQVRNMQKP